MAIRVVRKDLNGQDQAAAAWCIESQTIVRELGVLTVDEQIATLIAGDERVVGASRLRPVFKAGVIVGYIEVADPAPD
jgi:hypothetical protein